MQGERCLFLLTYMVAFAITVSLAFNIDIKNPDVYSGEKEDFYGYKVVQLVSRGTKGIVVTAPLHLNGSGEICKHENNSPKSCFSNKDISQEEKIIPVKHLGLSVAADSQSQLTVCSPSIAHECNDNSYLNSVCYKITDGLLPVSSFTPDFQECTKKTVDLVFLFDGSASMTEAEFTKNKDFIVDIMNSLKNTSIKFAAVQFSTDYRKVFDFNDYEAGTAHEKLMNEPHMRTLTNTHKALTFVMNEILENPDTGASPDATKVLVLITDGDPSDVDRDGIVIRYEKKNIIRFVIGVKYAKLDKFKVIASQPSDTYAFQIENYNGLDEILKNFQKRIFNIEGSTVARAGALTGEMSQSGFSAVYYKDTLILGSVGTDNWQGSLQVLNDTFGVAPGSTEPEPVKLDKTQVTSIYGQNMQNDSYMGYSVSVGQKNDAPLYFAGAPRSEHRGLVVLFRKHGKDWVQSETLHGDQIGSYFGAELCSVDIDSDGNTDFLLVGAPLFYQPHEKREGQIYVYTLTDELNLERKLNVTVPSMGRFGTAISSLADLNGDGLRDVAVGAPLEDDNSGAVYIYLGDRRNGIRSDFSQRIMGGKIPPGLRFFGQAIDGGMDLGEDGLPDIVIGSQGAAVVLRSRPVFDVKARLSFLPKELSIENFNCLEKREKSQPLVTVKTCFKVEETTKSRAVEKGAYVNISYTLSVDPKRQTSRGFFDEMEKDRSYSNSFNLKEDVCFNHTIFMPKCVKDTLLPLCIKVNFSQVNSENEPAILSIDSKRDADVEIPFEKRCAQNDTCIADIEVDFNFTTPTLLVAENNYFNLTIKLSNHGDDSYNTSLTMHYPPGLSFSRMTQLRTESSRHTHTCSGLEGVLDKTICSISHPVYRSRSAATFIVSFYLTDDEWNDTVSVTVTGKSDNSNMTERSTQTKNISVQFDVKLAVTVRQDTTTYLNFTTEDDEPKKLVTVYEISNPGLKAFPATVSLLFPTLLEYDFELSNYQISVQENKTQCNSTNSRSMDCPPGNSCQLIKCDFFTLDKESTTEFTLSGDVQFKNLKAFEKNMPFLRRYTGYGGEVRFRSLVNVTYDKKRYIVNARGQGNKDNSARDKSGETSIWRDKSPSRKLAEVRVEFIIPADQQLIILTGVGVGFLLLIIITIIMVKLGCFKRRMREDEDELSFQDGCSSMPINQSVAEGKSDCEKKPAELEVLLDDGQTDGSKPPANTEETQEEIKQI